MEQRPYRAGLSAPATPATAAPYMVASDLNQGPMHDHHARMQREPYVRHGGPLKPPRC